MKIERSMKGELIEVEKQVKTEWLSNLDVFAVNRVAAHSDHPYYDTMKEARLTGPMRYREYLNGTWKFSYAQHPDLRMKDFYETEMDCSHWDDIQVPGHIQLQGYGKPQYVNTMYPWDGIEDIQPPEIPVHDNAVGSYVKTFHVPGNMKDKPLYISFQGVESAFYVWLNGEFVGYSEDSFTPAEFELTPFVTDGENKLAVEVYQRSTGSWLEDQDFWRFSGIFRDVYLYSKPAIHVYDIKVTSDLNNTYDKGMLDIQCMLDDTKRNVHLALLLEDADGEKVDTVEADATNGAASLSLTVDRPHLWSAESPYLYKAFIQVYDETGALVEVIPQQVGFRTFEMKNGLMCLNGERIVFKGVNRHEFNCHHGRSVTKEDMLWDIKTLKKNNINAVRTSHYPNQTYWYELCDKYGVYVIDEMNIETHGTWWRNDTLDLDNAIPGNKMEWQDIVMDRAKSMYERDKNHPSILIWSVGNESCGGEVLYNVSNYFREVDPSRLVHYEGVFNDRSFNDTSDMESRMYAKPAEIAAYLDEHTDKPFIVCEYMHAMGNSLGGMKKYTDLEDEYAHYQGGFIWDYIDQGILKKDEYGKDFIAYGGDFNDRPTDYNFCLNGIVYADRELTPKMHEVRYLYQDIKVKPDRNGVRIHNKRLFTDTRDVVLTFSVSHEGEPIWCEDKEVVVAPQSEEYVTFNVPDEFSGQGEYVVHASLQLKEQTKWAGAGYEIAFGEYVFNEGKRRDIMPTGDVTLVDGDYNIGVHGEHFQAIFSRGEGSLMSLKYGGQEMIQQAPRPMFWRAITDNDRGTDFGFTHSAWFAASLQPKCTHIHAEKEAGYAVVYTEYALSIHSDVKVSVNYTIYADGKIKVQSLYEGVEGLPNLPVNAVMFKLPKAYDALDWYANGPHENYSDRANGAKLCTFQNKVSDNVSVHGVPQESGGRTGVRHVDITDHKGKGVRIASTDVPLECTISPYTAFELENASHHYELPPVHHTVATIAGQRMGVGGDDSWGAPVHEEYQINAEGKLAFEFMIEPV